jgi:oxygen-independent coproporphyrinogen-3 oxidase
MSALPGQSLADWEATLHKAADLQPEHISAYSLIIEEGTPFYERYREGSAGASVLPDEDTDREIYLKTKEILQTYGYHRYEISNYAKTGYECRHNLSYWTGTEYLGLGLGASSLLAHTRFHNTSELEEYIELCSVQCKCKENARSSQIDDYDNIALKDPFGLRRELQPLSKNMQMEEFMFLGLRITKGVNREEFRQRYGITVNDVYGGVIEHLTDQGLLANKGDYLYLTDYGIDVSNAVLAEFLLE